MHQPHTPPATADDFALAMAAWESGNLPEARRLARRIVENRPSFGGGYYLLGLITLRLGQPSRAVENLERAVAADPRQPVPRLALGRALEANARLGEALARLGRRDEAIAHCRQAVAAHPHHAEALNTLGALLHEAGRDDEAAEMLRRALEQRPNWALALHNFGLVLTALGRFEAAATILDGAVGLRPDHGPDRIALAGVLRRLGRLDRALAEAEHATRLAPLAAGGWVELGLVRQARGSGEGAAAAYERALGIDPAQIHAHWCLAECCRGLGEVERAARHYRACLELDPDDRHGAALGLAHLGLAPLPGRAPDAYVRRLFDEYAGRFDAALVEGLGYRGPAVLVQATLRAVGPLGDRVVLDAGCGTGLAGVELRRLAARLDGVDLSPQMIERARVRGIYDDLAVGELIATLAARPDSYDLVAAADVLVYLGDLAPVFAAARRALRAGGLLAFTLERDDDAPLDPGYRLGAASRYAHAPMAVNAAALAAGFDVLLIESAVTRRDGGAEVAGLVAVLRAGG